MEPLLVPVFEMPGELIIPPPVLNMPQADLPWYQPPFVPQKVRPLNVRPGAVGESWEEMVEDGQTEKNDKKETKSGQPPTLKQPPTPTTPDVKAQQLEGVTTLDLGAFSIPVPKPEILVAAGTTATVSVVATLTATSIFKKVVAALKPVVKKLIAKIQKLLKRNPPPTWARERLVRRRHRRLHTGNQA